MGNNILGDISGYHLLAKGERGGEMDRMHEDGSENPDRMDRMASALSDIDIVDCIMDGYTMFTHIMDAIVV